MTLRYEPLLDANIERDRLKLAMACCIITPNVLKNGFGDVDRARLKREHRSSRKDIECRATQGRRGLRSGISARPERPDDEIARRGDRERPKIRMSFIQIRDVDLALWRPVATAGVAHAGALNSDAVDLGSGEFVAIVGPAAAASPPAQAHHGPRSGRRRGAVRVDGEPVTGR